MPSWLLAKAPMPAPGLTSEMRSYRMASCIMGR